MNELYGADPAVCKTASDLRLLLSSFGPYTGRYLANYPTDWSARVRGNFQHAGDIEVEKISTLLRRAQESIALITRANLPWSADREWLENANLLDFDGLISEQIKGMNTYKFDEMELPPTTEERVLGNAAEYLRISKILLVVSPEIAFVDPYLNPLRRESAVVLSKLFQQIALGKCRKITLWTRASKVFGSAAVPVIKSDLTNELKKMASTAQFKSGCEIEMLLVDDDARKSKMHGRYLLSIKGGIRLDQGFQQLPQGRLVDVAPIGKKSHDALLDIFFSGKHDMPIVEKIFFKV